MNSRSSSDHGTEQVKSWLILGVQSVLRRTVFLSRARCSSFFRNSSAKKPRGIATPTINPPKKIKVNSRKATRRQSPGSRPWVRPQTLRAQWPEHTKPSHRQWRQQPMLRRQISHQILQARRLLARPRVDELRLACADRQRVGRVWRNPLYAKLVFLLLQ